MEYNCYSIFLVYALIACTSPLYTCSSIRLKAKDGSVIYARTMDFPQDTHSEIVAYPRNTEFTGTLPEKKVGLTWKNKYGFVGVNGLDIKTIVDGMNEKGLVCGLFYFAHYAKYEPLTNEKAKDSIAQWELGTFLLSKCATIQEVREILPTIHVVFSYLETQAGLPVHYVVHDVQGNCLVIEYVNGKLTTYDNPFGVLTNSPTFDWHMKNIDNYLHLFMPQTKKLTLNGIELFSPGEGNNLVGLPGDFTPPSRFIRLTVLSQTALQATNAQDGIVQAINIMNNVVVPRGPVLCIEGNKKSYDYTQWRTVHDLTNRRLYFCTYENPNFRYIDLKELSFAGTKEKRFVMVEQPRYQNYTNKLQ
jgi:choloylglycine hydrolase